MESVLGWDHLADLIFSNDELANFLKLSFGPATNIKLRGMALGFGMKIVYHRDVSSI